jgi:hypothetical protein
MALNVLMQTVVGPLVVTALVIIALGGVYSAWRAITDFHLRKSSGSLATFAAIRRASSRVSNFAADLGPLARIPI